MKKVLILGVMVLLMTGCKSQKKYEYYDLNGNYGISANCETNEEAKCLVNGEILVVRQYSEVKNGSR